MAKVVIKEDILKKMIEESVRKAINEGKIDEAFFQNVGNAIANKARSVGQNVAGAAKTVGSAVGNTIQSGAEQVISAKVKAAMVAVQGALKASPNNQYYKQALQGLQSASQALAGASKANMQQVGQAGQQNFQNAQNANAEARRNLTNAGIDAKNTAAKVKGAWNGITAAAKQGAANAPQQQYV